MGNSKLKNVKADNGEYLDFSHPRSMRVELSNKALGCIVSVETGEQYCLPVGESSGYSLPKFIYNEQVYVSAEPGTKVVLSDWDNLSYKRLASFIGTVGNSELKNIKADNGEYLDFSHPRSMRVE